MPWEKHYQSSKSVLLYPDENLVRMLKSYLSQNSIQDVSAIDLGCGTGRHLNLLYELGIRNTFGLDNSHNALLKTKGIYSYPLVLGENSKLPVKDKSMDIALSWGSLHYCKKNELSIQISEIYRILKRKGILFGTLRSDRDTYLKNGENIGNDTWVTNIGDIRDQIVSFYSEEELVSQLSTFNTSKYGLMERTIIGDMDKRISHWFFMAEK